MILSEIADKWGAIKKSGEFDDFKKNKPPLESYANTDWKKADPKDFVKLAFSRDGEGGNIYAEEAWLLANICLEKKPKLIVEIGRMHGTSTRLFAAIAKRFGGKVISIDGDGSLGVPRKLEILNLSENCELINGWSPWVGADPDWNIDFLFIDGDHSFIATIVDYHYYNYFLKKGGIVAFHDINILGVREAVKEIKKRDPLGEVGAISRLAIFEKLSERSEVYFQVIKRS